MISRSTRLAVSAFALLGASVWHSPPAHACGGCFHPPTTPTENASVITDHRMALSVSTTQTVLWDQIRYQGNPSEFAWVLPVGKGATIELARDEWLAALDALTGPIVSAPPLPSTCNFGNQQSSGGGFACGSASDFSGEAADGGAAGFDSGDGVQVISQEVVGPYQAVTIHSSSGEAITKWLTDNGFDIPASTQPILDAYTTEGFDFIALRLAPNQGVQAMRPVRVITPGADPTLPLRMVSAGIGASVGLTLYVIAEGRFESSNFPALLLDRTKVVWDPVAAHSNYAQLFDDTVTKDKGWVTEFSGSAGSLASTYQATCVSLPPLSVPCATSDAGDDASTSDASTDDASTDDASSDAASTDASTEAGDDAGDASCVSSVSACTDFTDYTVATTGMAPYDVRITRLRTTLPAASLAIDLKLTAGTDQSTLTNSIQSASYTDPNYNPCPAPPGTKQGCGCETAPDSGAVVSASLGLIALVSVARRRRRRDA